MSNFITWATRQLRFLDVTEEKRMEYESILDIFSEQGHSGFSAGYLISYVKILSNKTSNEIKEKLNEMTKETDSDGMQKVMNKDIIQILNKIDEYHFNKEEINNLTRLMDWKPIIPLTGEEYEWIIDNEIVGNITQQNRICSAVFRNKNDNSTAHYIKGRIFSDDGGWSWFTRGDNHGARLGSSIPVKFPFKVPDRPIKVYLDPETDEDITNNKVRINELYKIANNKSY